MSGRRPRRLSIFGSRRNGANERPEPANKPPCSCRRHLRLLHGKEPKKKRAEARFSVSHDDVATAYSAAAPSPSSTAFIDRRMRPCLSTSSTLTLTRSEEHTSELQSLMRKSYAVFCLKK